MGKGGYHGGSTLIHRWQLSKTPPKRPRRLTDAERDHVRQSILETLATNVPSRRLLAALAQRAHGAGIEVPEIWAAGRAHGIRFAPPRSSKQRYSAAQKELFRKGAAFGDPSTVDAGPAPPELVASLKQRKRKRRKSKSGSPQGMGRVFIAKPPTSADD